MILALRKMGCRMRRFLGEALVWRSPNRHYGPVAWLLLAGAAWLAAGLAGDPAWPAMVAEGAYLLLLLTAVCAIDARYGIIPNGLVIAMATGGIVPLLARTGDAVFQRLLEAALFLAMACLFRAAYRAIRGHDGLGLGDVKFAAAGVLWVGVEGVPGLLLIAVLSAMVSLLVLRADGHELNGKLAIPFGPHLAVGLWLSWIMGPLIL